MTRSVFSNRFTKLLPGDAEVENFCRQVHQAAWSSVKPTPVVSPSLLVFNSSLAKQTGLTDLMDCKDSQLLADVLSGNRLLDDMEPFAMAYAGHQFGHWAGQLGDGRAINLGEIRNAEGQHWTLQLKGAGPTPFSRQADGRAVLRSSLREYVCSEAMHALGVPTTRALSLVLTGESVVRDMFYDGHPAPEPGAIVCRVAPSFVRFGNFELPSARGDTELLKQLIRFVLTTDRPDLAARLQRKPDAWTEVCLEWYQRVCDETLHLVVEWMRVGFVHGVMNTDNMSVLGLTLDYGPYGWIDNYDPDWTPNTTDAQHRRYRFGQQGAIARWNLYQLANAIYPVVQDAEGLQGIVDSLQTDWQLRYMAMMCGKLGIDPQSPSASDLVSSLESLLVTTPVDMTLFYHHLSRFDPESSDSDLVQTVQAAFYQPQDLEKMSVKSQWLTWENDYRQLLLTDSERETRRLRMNYVNPAIIPRNYLTQTAIEALQSGSSEELQSLLKALANPYTDQEDIMLRFGGLRPDWALQKPGCSMLSCSS